MSQAPVRVSGEGRLAVKPLQQLSKTQQNFFKGNESKGPLEPLKIGFGRDRRKLTNQDSIFGQSELDDELRRMNMTQQ